MAKVSSWMASDRPQEKSPKTPQKHRQWLKAHRQLCVRLRKGINQGDDKEGSGWGLFYWEASLFA